MRSADDDGWRKSSASGTGNCVEWIVGPDSVRVRDSKDPGRELSFTHPEWTAFLVGVRNGEAELPGT